MLIGKGRTLSCLSHTHMCSSLGAVNPAINSAVPELVPSELLTSHCVRNTPHAWGKYPPRAKSNSASVAFWPPVWNTIWLTLSLSNSLRG